MELRCNQNWVKYLRKTEADVGTREVLHQLAKQHEPCKLIRVHADDQVDRGKDHRLDKPVDQTSPVVHPAGHLTLAVVHAVQRLQPRQRVLDAVHRVVHEVVDHVVDGEQHGRVVVEPWQPGHPCQWRAGAAGAAAAKQGTERYEYEIGERGKGAEQHQQRVVSPDPRRPPVKPVRGREPRFQWPKDRADDPCLERGDQKQAAIPLGLPDRPCRCSEPSSGPTVVAIQPVDHVRPQ